MGDTWDPYDQLAEIEAADASGGSKKKLPLGTPLELKSLEKVSAAGREKLFLAVDTWLYAGSPWKKVADVVAQLDWYEPTCTAEDWRHKDVKLDLSEGIAYVTLNRPAENNTLNDTIMHGLMDAVFAMHSRPDIRVVVIKAEGKMFSAGLDPNVVKHMRAGTKAADGDGSAGRNPIPKLEQSQETKDVVEKLGQEALALGAFPDGKVNLDQVLEAMLWQTMSRLPQVTIAFVEGSVMSTGLNIIAAVDMTFSSKNAYFCMEDLKMGLVPAMMMPLLCQKVGASNARFMVLTAPALTAEEAKHYQMVQELFDDAAGGHKYIEIECERLTACGPRSVACCKELVNGVAGNAVTDLVGFFTAYKLGQVTVSEEAKVGMVALQKRLPKPWEVKPIKPLY